MPVIDLNFSPGGAHDAVCPNGEVESLRLPLDEMPRTLAPAVSLRLPDPVARFSLRRGSLPGYTSSASSFAFRDMHFSLDADEKARLTASVSDDDFFNSLKSDTRRSISDAVMNFVNSYVDECAARQLYCAPFLAVAALRFADGSRVAVGPVQLLVADSGAPVPCITAASVSEDGVLSVTVALLSYPCRLEVEFGDAVGLADGGATHVDLLVSAPAATYRRDGGVAGICRLDAGSPLFSVTDRKYPLVAARCRCWDIGAYGEAVVEREMLSLHEFYVAESLPVADVASMTVRMTVGGCRADSDAVSFSRQPEIVSARQFACGTMRHLCGAEVRLPSPTVVSPLKGDAMKKVRLQAEVLKEGRMLLSSVGEANLPADGVGLPVFPSYIYYGDADAVALRVVFGEHGWRLPLQRCGELGGALWFGGLDGSLQEEDAVEIEDAEDIYRLRDRVMSGSVESRHYPLWSGVLPGEVYALVEASRTLAAGQPGAVPLYCLTSAGLWIARFEKGVKAVQLLTRHTLLTEDSYIVTPSGIRYASAAGRVDVEGTTVRVQPLFYEKRNDMELLTRPLKLTKRLRRVLLQPSSGESGARLAVECSTDLRRWCQVWRGAGYAARGMILPRAPYTRLRVSLPRGSELPRRMLI